MTVSELILALQAMPKDAKVTLSIETGGDYGSIESTCESIEHIDRVWVWPHIDRWTPANIVILS